MDGDRAEAFKTTLSHIGLFLFPTTTYGVRLTGRNITYYEQKVNLAHATLFGVTKRHSTLAKRTGHGEDWEEQAESKEAYAGGDHTEDHRFN